jgi:hypothetical protein
MAVYRVGEKFRVFAGKDKNGWRLTRLWAVYECDCESRFLMQCRSEAKTVSCGCFARETARQLLTGNTHKRTHNRCKSRTYKSWSQMKNRCSNSKYVEFEFYGGRGIKCCDRWMSFDAFLEDMGERPEGKTLDRINQNGNYEPENCRWATPKEQSRNTRRNVVVSIDGESKTVAEWCENPNAAKDKTIYRRLKLGWQGREAVFGKTK